MSKVIDRIDYLVKIGNDGQVATLIAAAEQLERIADALEKKTANQVDLEDGQKAETIFEIIQNTIKSEIEKLSDQKNVVSHEGNRPKRQKGG